MPIIDYERASETAYDAVMKDKSISDTNKSHVERFDKVYRRGVKPATRAKFYRHISFFLRENEDVTTLFDDPDAVNDLFDRLHKELSPGYYITVINVTNRFVKWLNDDVKPRGFKDVKSPKKSLQRRKLRKADMWEWEEGLNVAQATNSVQLKAVIMTQLNLGARPSEFIDLNFGDVELKQNGDLMVVTINDGKTGGREAILFHAVPYLARWLSQHPTKKPKDPLWILEDVARSHRKNEKGEFVTSKEAIVRATYRGIRKRVEHLMNKVGVTKNSDFYTLRHSCARLLRLWGVPVEQCAKQLGHSVKEFTETYGRLDTSDREAIHAKAYGLEVDDKGVSVPKPRNCAKCDELNEPEAEYCGRCGSALTVKKALERGDEEQARFRAMMEAYLDDPNNRSKLERAGYSINEENLQKWKLK